MGDERDGVDAVGERTDVSSSRPLRQPLRLKRIKQVADENRNRRARQHAPVHQLRRKAEDEPAQGVDEQQLDQIVESQPEETVDVTAAN